ncbi:hypothetical protein T06_2279 [Trichinella sp. T6]|nr:hypothetical protein T06_2279 [Trichinella sp. T6]
MDHPHYVSFPPEVSTAEDVRVWSGFPPVAYSILPVSLIWLQSWLGAFADMYLQTGRASSHFLYNCPLSESVDSFFTVGIGNYYHLD